MRTRVDAQDYYEDKIYIANAENWLRGIRERSNQDIGILHLFIAVMVRAFSQKPRINRFVAGQRIYSRNTIQITLAIKKRLHEDGLETTLKMDFDPRDTIFTVAEKVNRAIEANRESETTNETDRTAKLFMLLPRFLLRSLMATLRFLDYYGLLPRAIHNASPFHTSAFITDLGSLGIQPIYHHIYDFGTTSLFLAFGKKERELFMEKDGTIQTRKYIPIKVVNDERICDGHYYAAAFKYIRTLFQHPETLETAPETVVADIE
jgi:pyruvate/2-oxoglutarate dehydrogenase complex dihydrolipoamide acyltransferase (E2) component